MALKAEEYISMIAITCQKDGLVLLKPENVLHFFCFSEDEYQITYACPVCGQVKVQPISAGLAVLLQRDWGLQMYNISGIPEEDSTLNPVFENYITYFRQQLEEIEYADDIGKFCVP